MNLNKIATIITIITSIFVGLFPYIIVCTYKYNLVTDFEQFEPRDRVALLIISVLCVFLGLIISVPINIIVQDYRDNKKSTWRRQ